MDQTKYYKTNAFYLSAFLLAKGIALECVEKNALNKIIFVFLNSNELQNLVSVFNFGDDNNQSLLVNFKKAEEAIKRIKHIIHD